jgi:hypothetical protein
MFFPFSNKSVRNIKNALVNTALFYGVIMTAAAVVESASQAEASACGPQRASQPVYSACGVKIGIGADYAANEIFKMICSCGEFLIDKSTSVFAPMQSLQEFGAPESMCKPFCN